MLVTLLTAWDDNRLIGKGSGLPWHIPQDLKLFKERTKNQVVIMGKKTYEGLPIRPLPNRTNIVIMRECEFCDFAMPDWRENTPFVVSYGVGDAVRMAKKLWPDREVFICGGRSIYEQALAQDLVDRMLISIIPGEHEGNVYFPEFPWIWNRCILEEYDDFNVEVWTKDEK